MYHIRHKGTHYEAGYKWGDLLFQHGNIISNQLVLCQDFGLHKCKKFN